MAEIQTYPDGTPADGDKVPYVADPGGTPALMLADVADLGGGGWAGVDADDLTSLTGWTSVTGTWGVSGGQVTASAWTGDYSYLRAPTVPSTTAMRASVEFSVPSWGSDTRVGLIVAGDSATGNQPLGYYTKIGGTEVLKAERHNNVTMASVPVTTPLAAATWHRITVDVIGLALAVRVGADAAVVRDISFANSAAPRIFLLSLSDRDVSFRDFTVEGM